MWTDSKQKVLGLLFVVTHGCLDTSEAEALQRAGVVEVPPASASESATSGPAVPDLPAEDAGTGRECENEPPREPPEHPTVSWAFDTSRPASDGLQPSCLPLTIESREGLEWTLDVEVVADAGGPAKHRTQSTPTVVAASERLDVCVDIASLGAEFAEPAPMDFSGLVLVLVRARAEEGDLIHEVSTGPEALFWHYDDGRLLAYNEEVLATEFSAGDLRGGHLPPNVGESPTRMMRIRRGGTRSDWQNHGASKEPNSAELGD